jgi:hypothetical protein
MVAVMALPAAASVQNIKVSGSVDSGLLLRDNLDFGLSTDNDEKQSVFYTKTNLKVEADLTDNVQAVVSLINERAWNTPTDSNTDIDLHEAYVTLREMLYSPLTVIIGRQNFSYGNSFIVDSNAAGFAGADSGLYSVASDISNQNGMDAIRMILDYDPLTIEMLAAKINEGNADLRQDPTGQDDVDLYGVNATYELGDDMNTVVEAYFFAKIDGSVGKPSIGDNSKNDTIYVPGIRASLNVLEGLNVSAEYAHQGGTKSGTADNNQQKRDANAVFLTANYSLPVMEDYDPTLGYLYVWVSGDNDATAAHVDTSSYSGVSSEEKYTAWDPFYEDVGSPKLYNALFSMTNMQIHQFTLEAKPLEDVTASLSWAGLWLVQDTVNTTDVALLQPDNVSTASTVTTPGKKMIGQEVDLAATYDYTEDVQFGANVGVFMPGSLFAKSNRDAASQAMVNCLVNF